MEDQHEDFTPCGSDGDRIVDDRRNGVVFRREVVSRRCESVRCDVGGDFDFCGGARLCRPDGQKELEEVVEKEFARWVRKVARNAFYLATAAMAVSIVATGFLVDGYAGFDLSVDVFLSYVMLEVAWLNIKIFRRNEREIEG
jgi:hypothetical protein